MLSAYNDKILLHLCFIISSRPLRVHSFDNSFKPSDGGLTVTVVHIIYKNKIVRLDIQKKLQHTG